MNFFKSNIFRLIGISLFGLSLSACVSEEPFGSDEDSETLVKFSVDLNSTVTRAVSDDETSSLLNNCILYISNSQGLLHKWQGLNNIPASGVYLKYGNYVAEAWAGDSVPASFDSRFFEGYTNFSISNNEIPTQVTVNCKIRNVVVSVDASQLPEFSMGDLKVHVESSNGELDFAGEDLNRKGYFMRSYDKDTKQYDSELKYIVSGTDASGNPFTKEGTISNVQPAHEYVITMEVGEMEEGAYGGAIFSIKIYENQLDEEVNIHSAPQFKWADNKRLSATLQPESGSNFSSHTLLIGGYQDLKSLTLSITHDDENENLKTALGGNDNFDLIYAYSDVKDKLSEQGIEVTQFKVDSINTYSLKFNPEWFEKLGEADDSYSLKITAVDKRNLSNEMDIKIRTMFAPFSINEELWNTDHMSVRAHSAQISLIVDSVVNNLHLEYREKNSEDGTWKEYNPDVELKKEENILKLTGLKEGTEYEVRAVGGEYLSNSNRYTYEIEPSTFKTEAIFEIPNAGMDDWYHNGKVWEPALQKDIDTFWDTGNHGSTTISEDDNLTLKNTDIYHSNNSSAALTSKYVGLDLGLVGTLGKHGAGNLFIGKYEGTEKTTHGKINMGREYNESHPDKLSVWVKYIPAIADKGADDRYIKKGAYDIGQIYIALSTEQHLARTYDQTTLVNENQIPEEFIAYGQYTFEGNYQESDGSMKKVEIDFKYFDKAHDKKNKPKYLIVVCAASKYGDYFSGGEGSVMYVDDFELVYDE